MKLDHLKLCFPDHFKLAAAVRVLSMDAVQKANSGHPGMPMGMADVATVLFKDFLKYNPLDPSWPDRDRFILSAGHGSMLLYSLLYLTGYKAFKLEQLKEFRQLGSITAGHPEFHPNSGVETTTGPLGQGLANAVGFAIAEEHLRAIFGQQIVDHHTIAIVGDGCLMEGISQEALSLAGKLELSKLILLWDNNNITIDGDVSLSDKTCQQKRFQASGWDTIECDGHNPDEISSALRQAKASPKPAFVACKTMIGFGSPAKQGKASSHGSPLGEDEITQVRQNYDWNNPPFVIPDNIKSQWEQFGLQNSEAYNNWLNRFHQLSEKKQNEFKRIFSGEVHPKLNTKIRKIKRNASTELSKVATRKSSEIVLNELTHFIPELFGGSADLTGSNNTYTTKLGVFNQTNRKSRYIHYGIREHAMAAAMNGMALHGGLRPYGGTFLCFADYARPSIRLSSLMEIPVIYVMTHDSIGLGEDGPTHQPVEHLCMLRATPNLHVFRPCDTTETAESWQLALSQKKTPSILALSRQGLPTLRTKYTSKNLTARGAYILADFETTRQVILIASGSEVHLAMKARQTLQAQGIGVRVVSIPCWELFDQQNENYRRLVLPRGPIRVGIEAAMQMGWDRWLIGERGNFKKAGFIGMKSFGVSAPADKAYEKFGITTSHIVEKVISLLN
ncbi:MAG: transketolase [Rhodobacteraceae bacterium]|nr:transketolase [Paracoccaceae bacterium]